MLSDFMTISMNKIDFKHPFCDNDYDKMIYQKKLKLASND